MVNQPYKPLAEEDVETATQDQEQDQQRRSTAQALQMLMLATLLLLFLAGSMFQPRPRVLHQLRNEHDTKQYDCDIQLVESIPIGLNFTPGSVKFLSTFDAWKLLLDNAKTNLDIGSFYWSLRGEDTGTNHSSVKPGEEIFQRLLSNGNAGSSQPKIQIRIAQSEPTSISPNMDTKLLASYDAAEVVSVNFPKYFGGGVLHTKLWIVDGQHFYLGSANMDWRSLTQVKEMGVLAQNCPQLTADVAKIFKAYWYLGSHANAQVPSSWPWEYNTNYNQETPMELHVNKNYSMQGYISSSPPPLSAGGRSHDLDAILNTINSAVEFIHIAVMDYYPLIIYGPNVKYWPYIDDALRRAAIERGVSVKLLISWWPHSDPSEDNYLRSLQDLKQLKKHVDIQVRRFVVPTEDDQKDIPYGRVNHNKYMVTDRVAYIGTSNWSGDYFTDTAGIALVLKDSLASAQSNSLRLDLQRVFERDWNSAYAVERQEIEP